MMTYPTSSCRTNGAFRTNNMDELRGLDRIGKYC